jgi:hypothetical protein
MGHIIAGAIQAQIEGKTYRQAALDIGRNPNTFPKYMKRAARMLSAPQPSWLRLTNIGRGYFRRGWQSRPLSYQTTCFSSGRFMI